MQFSEVRKTVINVLTAVVTATPLILHELNQAPFQGTQVATTVSVVLGVIGLIAHYLVPNTTTDPAVAAAQSVKLVGPSAVVHKTTPKKATPKKATPKPTHPDD